ncbi:hypothetical protein O181_058434 [Austropuccinia psidii MF-1]|uniref:Uncharacterized protein n=1 Tax=Austropuccinia psidii MF-1 TaxID=1389203 RepID=A0A9Q3ECF2_9BASI|nr:hypothetical protein [Austropuccinia psidii MF-1]
MLMLRHSPQDMPLRQGPHIRPHPPLLLDILTFPLHPQDILPTPAPHPPSLRLHTPALSSLPLTILTLLRRPQDILMMLAPHPCAPHPYASSSPLLNILTLLY